jgi:hypothetical protein
VTIYQSYLLAFAHAGIGAASQRLFESITYDALVDTRTVEAVHAGLTASEYREMIG